MTKYAKSRCIWRKHARPISIILVLNVFNTKFIFISIFSLIIYVNRSFYYHKYIGLDYILFLSKLFDKIKRYLNVKSVLL